jgi:two-component system nitrate/nitrite response regulator NarL
MASPQSQRVISSVQRPRLVVVAHARVHREAFEEAIGRRRWVKVVDALSPNDLLGGDGPVKADVVIVDVAETGGIESLAAVVGAVRGLPVIAVGVPPLESAVVACAEAGAVGLVPEDGSLNEVLRTAADIASSTAPHATVVAEILLRRLRTTAKEVSGPRAQGLTRREQEVLDLIAEDLSNKEIAGMLHLSVPTVKNHVQSILKKLGMRRRAEAADWLRRQR